MYVSKDVRRISLLRALIGSISFRWCLRSVEKPTLRWSLKLAYSRTVCNFEPMQIGAIEERIDCWEAPLSPENASTLLYSCQLFQYEPIPSSASHKIASHHITGPVSEHLSFIHPLLRNRFRFLIEVSNLLLIGFSNFLRWLRIDGHFLRFKYLELLVRPFHYLTRQLRERHSGGQCDLAFAKLADFSCIEIQTHENILSEWVCRQGCPQDGHDLLPSTNRNNSQNLVLPPHSIIHPSSARKQLALGSVEMKEKTAF